MSDRVARLPLACGSTQCRAVTRTPGLPVTQVKLRPSSSSVTRQSAGGSLGWRMRAWLPDVTGGFCTR